MQVAGTIKGLVIGRFRNSSNVTEEELQFILDKHPQLRYIPVLYDLDFGLTLPKMTFPIGGDLRGRLMLSVEFLMLVNAKVSGRRKGS